MKPNMGAMERYVFNCKNPYLISDNEGGKPLMSNELVDFFCKHVDRALNTARDVAQVKLDMQGCQGKAVSSFRNLISEEGQLVKNGARAAFLLQDDDELEEDPMDTALAAVVEALQDAEGDRADSLKVPNRKQLSPLGHGVYTLAQFDLLFGELEQRLIWLFKHVLEDHFADESVGTLLRDGIARSRRALREYLRSFTVPV
jgi:hypothetical protein